MKIKWLGPDRFIPPIGTMETGVVRELNDDMACALIEQGMAEPYEDERTQKGGKKTGANTVVLKDGVSVKEGLK